jgi:hypothetical protein
MYRHGTVMATGENTPNILVVAHHVSQVNNVSNKGLNCNKPNCHPFHNWTFIKQPYLMQKIPHYKCTFAHLQSVCNCNKPNCHSFHNWKLIMWPYLMQKTKNYKCTFTHLQGVCITTGFFLPGLTVCYNILQHNNKIVRFVKKKVNFQQNVHR